jgi:hypothetical protein
MSQEEENLVDPQDDIELEALMKIREQEQEGQESEAEEEEELNDLESKALGGKDKEEPSHEQQKNIIITKEKKSSKPSKKKKVPNKPEPPPKVSNKLKGGKPLPYPSRHEKLKDSEVYDSFVRALKYLCLQLPLTDAIQVPTYAKKIERHFK